MNVHLTEAVKSGVLTAENTTSAPNATQSSSKAVASVGSHGCLDDFQWLSESGNLEPISCQWVAMRASKWGGTYMFNPAPRSRLLNLTGFFSGSFAVIADIVDGFACDGALTKGVGCFFAKEGIDGLKVS